MTHDTGYNLAILMRIRASTSLMHKVGGKTLSQDGILKTRDANRIICARKEKETSAEARKLAKLAKVYGNEPKQRSEEDLRRKIENKKSERRESFLLR